ncbi:MAG: hypothetical protein H7227_05475 [Actinobacteria bacterium]|nr:hypothetical protein [Actinomycetota bacterium]
MPSALLWSFSLFVSIQTPSFIVRLIAVMSCGIAAFLGSHLISRSLFPGSKFSLRAIFQNKLNVGLVVVPGLIFAITLENVSRYSDSGQFVRLLMVSNFVAALVVWLFIQVVVVPIRVVSGSQLSSAQTWSRAFIYLAEKRKSLAVSMASLLLGWPLFFFYFLLALTFAQAMTFSAVEPDDGAKVGN